MDAGALNAYIDSVRRRRRRVAAAREAPFQLGDSLLAWWDASYGLKTGWTDRKGEHRMTVVGPVWGSGAFNGRPGWVFDGVNDYMTMENQPFPSGSAPVEVFAVVQQNALVADTGNRNIFAYGGVAGLSSRVLQRRVVTGVNRIFGVAGNGTTSPAAGDTTVDFSGRHLVALRVSATAVFVAADGGSEATTATVPATGTSRVRIGSNTADTAANFWSGPISDIVVTGALDAAARAMVISFLLDRR